ncbi:MAG: sensor histidine kinase, partial [Anaerolineae bacterium]|nr:sensor histidine kinase [Anaerolineae bacterium]
IASTFANQAAIGIENDQLFTKAQASAAADERNRLAQELHDSVTQTLFTASILAQATPRIWKRDVSLAQQNMEKLNTLLRGALAEMRSLFIELRSGELQNQTLGKLLTMLVEAGRTRTLATITLTINRDHFLPGKVITPIYRIAQEALNNAINHSNASQIEINMDSSGELLELHIQDDGCGFIPEEIPAGHLGLNIMQERAAQIQAGLHIQSEPGIGTVIAIRWPEKGEYSENE